MIRKRVIATGNFDGCHLGHKSLFDAVQREAAARGLAPLIVTFEPHTKQVLSPDPSFKLLTPLQERTECIRNATLPVEVLNFADIRHMPFQRYMQEVLVDRLGAALWVLGHDHRFGFGAQGNAEAAQSLGLSSLSLPAVEVGSVAVSSSRIRTALAEGDLDSANAQLGRPYRLSGEIVHGDARGRTIGFPTANIQVTPNKLLPAFGVYGGKLHFDAETRLAVANIGIRPTFGGVEPSVEVHLPGFSGDLYGKTATLELNLRIRGEMRFERPEHLISRIGEDIRVAQSLLP